jgi:hypothetical protein
MWIAANAWAARYDLVDPREQPYLVKTAFFDGKTDDMDNPRRCAAIVQLSVASCEEV